MKSRVWVYLRRSTLGLALRALARWRSGERDELEAAAEDLRLSERRAGSGSTREEIEQASHDYDKGGP